MSSLRVRQLPLVACLAVICALSACSTPGEPIPTSDPATSRPVTSTPAPIRQTDDRGKPLPFTTRFPNRWSANNNGTSYEPCTALNDAELTSLGLDPTTVEDAALANHQTARGCIWKYFGKFMGGISQSTGNRPTFEYELTDTEWYIRSYTTTIGGRLMIVNYWNWASCFTIVKVENARVTTSVTRSLTQTPEAELCNLAIEFTKLTIPKMPPPAP
ncbi:DUF3558 domain-containing protein [Gordonia pseudamarae]|jgi:hypothetical protein|uniref:DUF3558 domain-containing protein n=1 Tax=Gordonia pseudamarae TaxID=2831662 RepID=A0ABX6IHX2_9ACTN|nr:DUF3558 domain-containing protein [Gordonia sp. (in: high G+C Gram-positive bacteria)]QHN25805.1 DUF3558 domain-containing protein [Gordonia pseudamarae]QHN34736.1 DUF3558 domain-containing protein [Gordonia pseudamarae]